MKAEVRQEWRHSICQQPVRSALVIHSGHFVSESHHKSVCHEKGERRSLCLEMWVFSDACPRYGEGKSSSKAAWWTQSWMIFYLLSLQLLFPCSLLIIQSGKTGSSHVCCIYQCRCYLSVCVEVTIVLQYTLKGICDIVKAKKQTQGWCHDRFGFALLPLCSSTTSIKFNNWISTLMMHIRHRWCIHSADF